MTTKHLLEALAALLERAKDKHAKRNRAACYLTLQRARNLLIEELHKKRTP